MGKPTRAEAIGKIVREKFCYYHSDENCGIWVVRDFEELAQWIADTVDAAKEPDKRREIKELTRWGAE